MIERLAVVRVRVTGRQVPDRPAKVGLRLGERPGVQEPAAEGGVAAAIVRVAAEGLLVVRLRRIGRVAVLLQVQPVQEEFLVRRDLGRGTNGCGRLGDRRRLFGLRGVGDQPSIGREDLQGQLGLLHASGQRLRTGVGGLRREALGRIEQHRFASSQTDPDLPG